MHNAELSFCCHCEPVTDVTGVAIRSLIQIVGEADTCILHCKKKPGILAYAKDARLSFYRILVQLVMIQPGISHTS